MLRPGLFAFVVLCCTPWMAWGQGGALDPKLLAGLEARSIGPATMSGRIASIDAVVSDPRVIYVGAATGGLWKSVNAGLTWEPLFDDQPVHSIGAVSIYQASPEIVWVGTGEGNPRNSASVGNGVYRSLDGGRNWTYLGLDKTEKIHRICLHPTNPDVAYVAALGTNWGENPERGVFRTRDGGKTWDKVLFVDNKTGCADLVMDPTNPDKLFAALWENRRWPWSFKSGGPGSGIYVSRNGGEDWTQITDHDGLPKGELGRIGLAIAPSRPSTVYAYVEAKENAICRSDDGGATWRTVGTGDNIGNRPFYYADLRVDPKDPERVYSLWSLVSVSNDGGKTFNVLVPFAEVHPDHHEMWIHPERPEFLINGNDGGIAISHDHGLTWKYVHNLPLAQFYHVRVDMEHPFNIYGGLQDNGSWKGPSSVWENGSIRNYHWQEVAFGDGFDTVPDPRDSTTGFAMSQEGFLYRWDSETGTREYCRPVAPSEDVELRFNWSAGIALDPRNPDTVYFGSQFVHRSRDRGNAWEIISDDLTTNDPNWQKQDESGGLTLDVTGAENFCSILSIAPSPLNPDVIWVGTDDGRLHLTHDAGENWSSLERRIAGVPKNTWIPHVIPSQHNSAVAYVIFDDHRRANWTPYVYRTTNFGNSWENLATSDVSGYCLSLAEDPVDPDLLFLGTEFGLYVSCDRGANWMRFNHGVPHCSVMDLALHPRDGDLVIATHGRALFILDDVRPLRGLRAEHLEEKLRIYEMAPAQQHWIGQTGSSRFPGHGEFRGKNRPYGAIITYSLNDPSLPHPDDDTERARKAKLAQSEDGADEEEKPKDEKPHVMIEIADPDGAIIRTFRGPAQQGMNRAVWNLTRKGHRWPEQSNDEDASRPDEEPEGPQVLPGRYQVTVKYQDATAAGSVLVRADPRFDISLADRLSQHQAEMRVGALGGEVKKALDRIEDVRHDIERILAKQELARPDDEKLGETPLGKAAAEFRKKLTELEKKFWHPEGTKGIPADKHIMSKIGRAAWALGSTWEKPTSVHLTLLARAEAALKAGLAELNATLAEQVPLLRDAVAAEGIRMLPDYEPLSLPQ